MEQASGVRGTARSHLGLQTPRGVGRWWVGGSEETENLEGVTHGSFLRLSGLLPASWTTAREIISGITMVSPSNGQCHVPCGCRILQPRHAPEAGNYGSYETRTAGSEEVDGLVRACYNCIAVSQPSYLAL